MPMVPVIKSRQPLKRLLYYIKRRGDRKLYVRNSHIDKSNNQTTVAGDAVDSSPKVTVATPVVAAHAVTTITIVTFASAPDLSMIRLHYSVPGSDEQLPLGYQHGAKAGGGLRVLRVYTSGGSLKADVMNTGSVDLDVRVVYAEVTEVAV